MGEYVIGEHGVYIYVECEMYYYTRTRKPAELEGEYHVSYMDFDTLARECDIISIHVPVTEETTGMINKAFLEKMFVFLL